MLLDLQGPKLHVGTFAQGAVTLVEAAGFQLDMDREPPGDTTRVSMPHPEILDALVEGTDLLLDDGRIRLRVEEVRAGTVRTRVIAGGRLSDRKGVNVPGVVLSISALTAKDRADLDFGLTLGVRLGCAVLCPRPEASSRSSASSPAVPASSPSWRNPLPSPALTRSWPRVTR